jgi:hypothetical protein
LDRFSRRSRHRSRLAFSTAAAALPPIFLKIPGALECDPCASLLFCLPRWRRRCSRLQTLADLWRDVADKALACAEALSNIHALLPSLQLSAIELLKTAELFQVFVFVIKVVEVKLAHLIESPGELAPGTLPFGVASLTTSSSLASTRTDMISTS